MNRHPVPWTAYRVDDLFWNPRLHGNLTRTLLSQWDRLHETGRLAALGIWDSNDPAPGPHAFFDSDVAKWLEALAYHLACRPEPELRTKAERIIAGYEAIQQPDGYCNQAFVDRPDQRWTNLQDGHELYCAGHLIEAGVAWFQGLHEWRLLNLVEKLADHIEQRFGPEGIPGIPGHPEIELALVRLAKATDNPRRRQLARTFVDRRGQKPSWFELETVARGETVRRTDQFRYYQAHLPVREVTTVEGHAVRALYLLAGMVELGDDDPSLAAAVETWWGNAVARRMFVTGGFGSNHQGEVFTHDFDLPNREAYAETCASIAGALVARGLLTRRLRGRDADALEVILYNGMLAGLGLDGERYYYANPLTVQPGIDNFHKGYQTMATTTPARQKWYKCSCCPPNIARVLASLGGYVADANEAALDIHLYVGGTFSTGDWRVRLTGDYVWQGKSALAVDAAPSDLAAIRFRLPGWRTKADLRLNGEPLSLTEVDGYAVIVRHWQAGDQVDLDFGIAPRRVHADPRIPDNAGYVAIQRGPLIYCLEQCDHEADLFTLSLHDDSTLADEPCYLAPGAMAVVADGLMRSASTLYSFEPPSRSPCRLRFIPFSFWANRDVSAMRVWVPR